MNEAQKKEILNNTLIKFEAVGLTASDLVEFEKEIKKSLIKNTKETQKPLKKEIKD
jgi:hypothetical protein